MARGCVDASRQTSSVMLWGGGCLSCLHVLPTWCFFAEPYCMRAVEAGKLSASIAMSASSDGCGAGGWPCQCRPEQGNPVSPSSLCKTPVQLSFCIAASLRPLWPPKGPSRTKNTTDSKFTIRSKFATAIVKHYEGHFETTILKGKLSSKSLQIVKTTAIVKHYGIERRSVFSTEGSFGHRSLGRRRAKSAGVGCRASLWVASMSLSIMPTAAVQAHAWELFGTERLELGPADLRRWIWMGQGAWPSSFFLRAGGRLTLVCLAQPGRGGGFQEPYLPEPVSPAPRPCL